MSQQSEGRIKLRTSGYTGCCGATYLYTTNSAYGINVDQLEIEVPITMSKNNKDLIDRLDQLISKGKKVKYSVLDEDYIVIFKGTTSELANVGT